MQVGNAMGEDNQPDALLTIREVSQILYISKSTLRRWSDLGIVKAYRVGSRGDRRFRPEDIAGLLSEEDRAMLIRHLASFIEETKDR